MLLSNEKISIARDIDRLAVGIKLGIAIIYLIFFFYIRFAFHSITISTIFRRRSRDRR